MQAAVAGYYNDALFVALLVVNQSGRYAVLRGGTFQVFNGEVGADAIVEELNVPAWGGSAE